MTLRRILVVLAGLAIMVIGPAGVASAAHSQADSSSACDGGSLAPGTYSSITVTGFCAFEPGVIRINGGLTVAPGGAVDATNCDLQLTITGGVTVGEDAILGLGGARDTGCDAPTGTTVRGGLRATNAMAVLVHGTNVSGGVVIDGGGVQDCEFSIPGLGFPTFDVFEDGSINGGLTVTNLTTCWFGMFRNTINGGVHVTNNSFDDPDANEIQTNTIHGPLVCTGNSPAAQRGDSEGFVNTVSGPKVGECNAPGI
jgi:hypothetical protein